MGSYDRNSRSGGRRYGGGGNFPRRPGRREMHKAVCDECGKDCEVPFRPSGDKPIYCSNCFEGKDERSSRKGPRGDSFGQRDNTNKQLLEQVSSLNAKLDRILKVIEPRVEKKPVPKKPKVKKVVKKAAPKDEAIETKKVSKEKLKKSPPKE